MAQYSVTEINRFIKNILSAEEILHNVSIRGEISNFTHHLRSGHFYFTLKDSSGSIRCVMFKSSTLHLPFMPENGMQVVARGDVQVFERDGVYQLYCFDLQPDGLGAKYLALEQLRNRLAGEGLFDPERKRPLPPLPMAVGVVTSKTGAALQDIRQVLSRRYPICTLKLYPALVQGEQAPQSICHAIQAVCASQVDLLIVGRGGGTAEDLWAFNDESVVRAIAACPVPVISAVGHEVDITLADYAADQRAPTPTAAAELAVPDRTFLLQALDNTRDLLYNYTVKCMENAAQTADQLSMRLKACAPGARINQVMTRQEHAAQRLEQQMAVLLSQRERQLQGWAELLDSLSPLKVLTRGYAIVLDQQEQVIRSVKQLREDQLVNLRLSDGTAQGMITSIKR